VVTRLPLRSGHFVAEMERLQGVSALLSLDDQPVEDALHGLIASLSCFLFLLSQLVVWCPRRLRIGYSRGSSYWFYAESKLSWWDSVHDSRLCCTALTTELIGLRLQEIFDGDGHRLCWQSFKQMMLANPSNHEAVSAPVFV
jgi:hypothetical protein